MKEPLPSQYRMLKWGKRLQAVQDKVSIPFSGTSSSGQVTSIAGHCLAVGSPEGQGSFVIPDEPAKAVVA